MRARKLNNPCSWGAANLCLVSIGIIIDGLIDNLVRHCIFSFLESLGTTIAGSVAAVDFMNWILAGNVRQDRKSPSPFKDLT